MLQQKRFPGSNGVLFVGTAVGPNCECSGQIVDGYTPIIAVPMTLTANRAVPGDIKFRAHQHVVEIVRLYPGAGTQPRSSCCLRVAYARRSRFPPAGRWGPEAGRSQKQVARLPGDRRRAAVDALERFDCHPTGRTAGRLSASYRSRRSPIEETVQAWLAAPLWWGAGDCARSAALPGHSDRTIQ
jgi:hypothetical protein